MLISPARAEAANDVATWVGLLQHHVPALLPQLAPEDRNYGRKDLIIQFDTEAVAEPPVGLKSRWRAESLYLVSLIPITKPENTTKIDNRILLGQFKGTLAGEYVNFAQVIVPDQFEPARDVMVFVTLYTYAMYRAGELSHPSNPKPICDAVGEAIVVGEHLNPILMDEQGDLVAQEMLLALRNVGAQHCQKSQ